MAGNAVIGALRVVLGADTASLEKGLKQAQSHLGSFAKTAGIVMSGAAAALGGGLGLAVKGAIDRFDQLSKTSQKIGIPTEQLSALTHAAKLSDVSIESLQKGVARLARNAVEAGQGLSTPLKAFKALNINFRDSEGNIKTVGDLLPEIANKFAKMRDGPEKTALAMQLLGRAGADMIPLLNGGAAGLKQMTDEARQLGLVISGETGRTAEAFNDNLTRLRAVLTGVVTQFTANILPALAQFSDHLVNGAKNSGFLQAATGVLTTAFNGLARAAMVVHDNFGLIVKIGAIFIGAQIGAAAIAAGRAFIVMAASIRAAGIVMAAFSAIASLSTRGILILAGLLALATGQFDNLKDSIAAIYEKIKGAIPPDLTEGVRQTIEALGLDLKALDADLNSWKPDGGPAAKGLGGVKIAAEGATKAIDSFLTSVAKRQAALQAELQTIGLGVAAHQSLRIVLEAEALAKEKNIRITDAMRAKIEGMAKSYGNLAQLVERAKERFGAIKSAMEGISSKFEDALVGLADGSKKAKAAFADMAKGILSDLVRLMIRINVTLPLARALTSAFGGGGGLFGGLLGGGMFGGLGGLFGFAKGGSFTVPVGGSAGIDSQIAAFRVTPGERVSVTKPGQDGGMGGGQVVIRVVPNDDRFNAYVDGRVGRAAPAIVSSAVGAARGQVVPTMARHQAETGGEWRVR